ncbi:MAG: alpha-N-arabinofuranosidase [Ruminococcaceae bacterium]|nr:alpha-N-arabinofuranosidase [Oscillospiraceae bacterium]
MKAEIIINKNYTVGKVDPRLYGSFIEHIGRAVYTGIYEPDHPTADKDGFRQDVIELVKKLNVPIVRYPGGNFVSGYNWEDGVGPKEKRPKRQELAWFTTETNQFGTDEFCTWAKKADTDVMMAVNLGTRGADDARNLVEYCNFDGDTKYAKMRKENGYDKPHDIKVWCLGNEMDGPWQICHKTAEEYGRVALESAKLMKWADSTIELVLCGSSGYNINTFGEWEWTVLNHAYNNVDYISLHTYYGNDGNDAEFLGRSVQMNEFIQGVKSICDAVKAKKHSKKTINLSFDEWNLWYHDPQRRGKDWKEICRVNEDIYNFGDALLLGCMLMTLQNNCDRVKMACLAQLVNVIAPIMTEPGGKAWCQTIFYPFMYGSNFGRGTVMNTITKCDSYKTSFANEVPYIETSVINDEEKRELHIFAVNRNLSEDMEVELTFENFGECEITEHIMLYSDDLLATNSAEEERIAPINVEVCKGKKTVHSVKLKKHSWNMIKLKY